MELGEGDRIPADGVLIPGISQEDEFLRTRLPSEGSKTEVDDTKLVYGGTRVVSGDCRAIVVATKKNMKVNADTGCRTPDTPWKITLLELSTTYNYYSIAMAFLFLII